MEYTFLPETKLRVSKICLGTMTWGEQNTEADAHQQLDYAVTAGINFIDTAEMYAIPANPATQGLTEKYIGTWLKHQDRSQLVIASKIAGPSAATKHIRGGSRFNQAHIAQAIEESLTRLQTDYIDLYQLHWPERPTNFFGTLGYSHHSDDAVTDFKMVLEVLSDFIQQGKIKHIGISNETPWGMMQFLMASKAFNLPKICTIQNPYNLVNRTFEIGLAEMSIREQVGLLAYSPLAGGLLSTKYLDGKRPEGSRYTLWSNYFGRYNHPNTMRAVEAYATMAKASGLSLSQMALAYVTSRKFLTSNIIGATTLEQLKQNIDSIHVQLTDDVLKEIERIHLEFPNPAP